MGLRCSQTHSYIYVCLSFQNGMWKNFLKICSNRFLFLSLRPLCSVGIAIFLLFI